MLYLIISKRKTVTVESDHNLLTDICNYYTRIRYISKPKNLMKTGELVDINFSSNIK